MNGEYFRGTNLSTSSAGAQHQEQRQGHGYLTPDTRLKILAAAKELNLDIEALSSADNRAVLNVLYGNAPDYGLANDVGLAEPTEERLVLFHGPFGVCGNDYVRHLFNDPLSTSSGVYLWTLETDGGEYVHYVGQTMRGFAKRQAEHLEKILSGQYNTYDLNALKSGKVERISPSNEAWPQSLPDFLATYETAASKRVDYIKALRFYLTPLTNQGDHILNRLEGTLGRHFLDNQDRAIKKFLGAGFTVPAPIPGAATTRFKIQIADDREIVGMPDHLIG